MVIRPASGRPSSATGRRERRRDPDRGAMRPVGRPSGAPAGPASAGAVRSAKPGKVCAVAWRFWKKRCPAGTVFGVAETFLREPLCRAGAHRLSMGVETGPFRADSVFTRSRSCT